MTEIVEHIDPFGTVRELEVEWGTSGRFMPPVQYEEDEIPEQPGSRVRAVRHKPREFVLPLWITDTSDEALRAQIRDLVGAFDPSRGDSKIRVTAPAGDQREITCRYMAGLDLQELLGETSAPGLQRAPLVMRAHDPYWSAVSEVVETFDIGTPSSWFPFFPLRLSSSAVFADVTVDAVGDAPQTWPVWTVTGPGSGLVLSNLTTGKSLSLSTVLALTETLVIDTRPGHKTITNGFGANLFGDMASLSSLWPLIRGSNAIRVEFNSATVDSSIKLAFLPKYLTA